MMIDHKVKSFTIVNKPEDQYLRPNKLFDFELGSINFRDTKWNRYLGNNLDVTADLGTVKTVNRVSVSCMGSSKDWILFPTEAIVYSSSQKNSGFKKLNSIPIKEDDKNNDTSIKMFHINIPETKARYFKVLIKNPKVLPKWHPGAGNASWIFVDEILVQ